MLRRCINLSKASGQKARRTFAMRGKGEKGGCPCVAGNTFAFVARFPIFPFRFRSTQPLR